MVVRHPLLCPMAPRSRTSNGHEVIAAAAVENTPWLSVTDSGNLSLWRKRRILEFCKWCWGWYRLDEFYTVTAWFSELYSEKDCYFKSIFTDLTPVAKQADSGLLHSYIYVNNALEYSHLLLQWVPVSITYCPVWQSTIYDPISYYSWVDQK